MDSRGRLVSPMLKRLFGAKHPSPEALEKLKLLYESQARRYRALLEGEEVTVEEAEQMAAALAAIEAFVESAGAQAEFGEKLERLRKVQDELALAANMTKLAREQVGNIPDWLGPQPWSRDKIDLAIVAISPYVTWGVMTFQNLKITRQLAAVQASLENYIEKTWPAAEVDAKNDVSD